jgi:hypothetical protein
MVMNLSQAGLEAFLSERWAQHVKNKTHRAKDQTYYTPQHIYDSANFELAIRDVDIQIGWRDAVQRHRKYMRRCLFMGKLNPEKCSQRLQDMNKYLDYIPIKKTTVADKMQKAYGKSLPADERRSIIGLAISPEWTVNLLALGKEPWHFKDLDDQLNMYCQQWQSDHQKQIIAKMARKMPGKSNNRKEKTMKETIIIAMVVATVVHDAKGVPETLYYRMLPF